MLQRISITEVMSLVDVSYKEYIQNEYETSLHCVAFALDYNAGNMYPLSDGRFVLLLRVWELPTKFVRENKPYRVLLHGYDDGNYELDICTLDEFVSIVKVIDNNFYSSKVLSDLGFRKT